MARVWFDFGAATNGDGKSPKTPRNTIAGYTVIASDEHYFRRGTSTSTALPLVAGAPGKPTKYRSWYNEDGTDDLTKARCVFNLTATLNTYATSRDSIELDGLKFSAPLVTVANDACIVFLGHNSSFTNCEVDTNVGCVGAAGKSNILIQYNTLKGVSHGNANGNNLIFATDSKDVDNIRILNNTLTFMGGGNGNSHGIRAGADTLAFSMTNLIIRDNVIAPPAGTAKTPNHLAMGIRLQRCPDAEIAYNNVKGMVAGLFMTGGGTAWAAWVHHNNFSDNHHFGIHAVTDMIGCLIEYNDCSRNGTNIDNGSLKAYGRGIEFSGAAGQSRCGHHVVRYNVCNGNLNYGGPLDNGSEGVGLGFDDGTVGCTAYGNIFIDNEGNGVQYYGGPLGAGWNDTSNHCVANFFRDNCKATVKNRRTGGTFKTAFSAHIGMSATIGGTSVVANNVMIGSECGISQTANCTAVVMANNIFYNVLNAIAFGHAAGYGSFNNLFFATPGTIKRYVTTALDANGVPTYPTLAYNGTNDLTSNPLLDANYRPLPGSPCIGAGNVVAAPFSDYSGRKFKATPSVGMFEDWTTGTFAPIRL